MVQSTTSLNFGGGQSWEYAWEWPNHDQIYMIDKWSQANQNDEQITTTGTTTSKAKKKGPTKDAKTNNNWLVVEPHLWKIWKSVGIIIPNIWKKMFQTTNQTMCLCLKIPQNSRVSRSPFWKWDSFRCNNIQQHQQLHGITMENIKNMAPNFDSPMFPPKKNTSQVPTPDSVRGTPPRIRFTIQMSLVSGWTTTPICERKILAAGDLKKHYPLIHTLYIYIYIYIYILIYIYMICIQTVYILYIYIYVYVYTSYIYNYVYVYIYTYIYIYVYI